MIIWDDYKQNVFNFPNSNQDPKKKLEKEYSLKTNQAIYSAHIRGKTAVPVSDEYRFWENRQYGVGRQPVAKYKEYYLGTSETTSTTVTSGIDRDPGGFDYTDKKKSKRKGWMNVLWEPISPFPVIKNSIHGQLNKADHDIIAMATDPISVDKRDYIKWRNWVETKYKDVLQKWTEMSQMQYLPPEFQPESLEEQNLYESAGGYKLNYEIQLEKLIGHTIDISEWEEIKESMRDDAMDIGLVAIRAYLDHETKKIKWRYVDPAPGSFCIQYSKHFNFHDSTYAGEVEQYTVSKIVQILKKQGYGDTEIKNIVSNVAKKYSGQIGNPSFDDRAMSTVNIDSNWIWDNYRVEVFDLFWIETDVERKLFLGNDKFDREKVIDLSYNEPVRNSKGKVEEYPLRQVYHSKWIINTDVVFDYGYAEDVIWENGEPQIPYKVYRLKTPSLVDLAKPWIDRLNLDWFDYQNKAAMAWSTIMGFDLDSLTDLSLGNNVTLTAFEAIRMARELGVYIYRGKNLHNQRQDYKIPVDRVAGGTVDDLKVCMEKMNYDCRQIEYYTGINPLVIGGQPDERQGKGVMEAAIGQGQNNIVSILNATFNVKKQMANYTAVAVQHLIKTSEKAKEAYTSIIGKDGVQILLDAEKDHVQMGIVLEPKPTDEMWATIQNYINTALAMGRDGVAALEIDDAFRIQSLKDNGMSYKMISLYIQYAIKKKKMAKKQEAKDTMQQQQNNNMELENTKAKNLDDAQNKGHQMEKDKMDHQSKTNLIESYGKAFPDKIPSLVPEVAEMVKDVQPQQNQPIQTQQVGGQ
jgi:hypothetical protein